jgi:putative ABC transport system permease protein
MKEAGSLLHMFLKLFLTRPGSGMIILIGVAGITGIVVSLFTLAEAFEKALAGTGQTDRVLVLRAGSTSEINGNVALNQFPIVRDMSEVERVSDGGLASRETYVTVNLPMKDLTLDATLPLRGVEGAAFDVRPEVQITRGRSFNSGKYELIAGIKAAQTFAGLGVGKTIRIRGHEYLVTGHFSAAGSANETELWMDERLLAQTLGRGDTFSSILVRLKSPDLLTDFQKRISGDRRLTLSAHQESAYYEALAKPTIALIQGLGFLVGTIMALGAIAAAVNSMQTALESRTREIATLRALGFGRYPVLAAILAECTLLSVLGATLALAVVFLLFDGQAFSTVAAATTSGSQVGFEFRITKMTVGIAAGLAAMFGIAGGLIPGVVAIRRPIPQALRG